MENLKLFLFFTVTFYIVGFKVQANECCSTLALPPHNFSEPISLESAIKIFSKKLLEYNKNSPFSKELHVALDGLMEKYSAYKMHPNSSALPELSEALLELSDLCLPLKEAAFVCELSDKRVCSNPRVNESQFCNLIFYNLFVSTVEVGNDEYQGNRLLEFVDPLVHLTKERIFAMQAARKALFADMNILRKYGLTVYDPSLLTRAQRFPKNKQRLNMTMDGSPKKDFPSQVLVPTSDFSLGESDYDDSSIYQKHDLFKILDGMNMFELCKSAHKKGSDYQKKFDAIKSFSEIPSVEEV